MMIAHCGAGAATSSISLEVTMFCPAHRLPRLGGPTAGAALIALALLGTTGCRSSGQPATESSSNPAATGTPALASAPLSITVESPDFQAKQAIPAKHTCEGTDTSPALSWSGLPAGTKSLALVVDDPDAPDPQAPKMVWVHWVLYNIPPDASGLSEGAGAGQLPAGTKVGKNDWKRADFGGPCPPIGRHRYFHKVYALDVMLPDLGEPTKADLEKAMTGHVLARGELVGTYEKVKSAK
jgi:Raf kinase inhibitor-like YbhB/YbcL family protein